MSADDVFFYANWVLVGALILGVLATYAIVVSGNIKDTNLKRELGLARERAAALEDSAAKAREHAALLEKDLLAERRLTARERWLMERVARAVLPRQISPEQAQRLIDALRGKISELNMCVVNRPEPTLFALNIRIILGRAGIHGRDFKVAEDANHSGIRMFFVDDAGQFVAQTLANVLQMPVGLLGSAFIPDPAPKDQNCLLIGENDAALQGGSGQPGEGRDEHGRPVPAPQ